MQTVPGREKYWKELSSDEKTERLRNELKLALRKIEGLELTVEKLMNHFHGSDGSPALKLQERLPFHGIGRGGRLQGGNDDESYL